jgi:hypothetical protein
MGRCGPAPRPGRKGGERRGVNNTASSTAFWSRGDTAGIGRTPISQIQNGNAYSTWLPTVYGYAYDGMVAHKAFAHRRPGRRAGGARTSRRGRRTESPIAIGSNSQYERTATGGTTAGVHRSDVAELRLQSRYDPVASVVFSYLVYVRRLPAEPGARRKSQTTCAARRRRLSCARHTSDGGYKEPRVYPRPTL